MLKFNDYLKEAKKCTDEELVGNQHKLDKNKNGKIDADDLKKLRSTKEDEMEGFVSHAQRKAVWASRNEKGVKEETELDEGDAKAYYSGHRAHKEGKSILDNPHPMKTVLARREWDRGWNDRAKEQKEKSVKEETDLDESYSYDKDDALRASMHANERSKDANLHDVAHSRDERTETAHDKALNAHEHAVKMHHAALKQATDPKDIKMHKDAIADHNKKADQHFKSANYKGARTKLKEETEYTIEDFSIEEIEEFMMSEVYEQLDELSKKTLGSYVKKAAYDVGNKMFGAGSSNAAADATRSSNKPLSDYHQHQSALKLSKSLTRLKGVERASKKIAKEEVEQIDEISKDTMKSYVTKAATDIGFRGIDAGKNSDRMDRLKAYAKMGKRVKGIEKATNKLSKEEVEQIDEISAKTKLSYVDKASRHAASHVYNAKDKANWASHYTQAGDWESSKKAHDQSAKEFNKANKRLAGVKAAVKSLAKNVKEEASLQEGDYYHEKVAKALPKGLKSDHEILNHAHDHMQKDLKGKYSKNAIHRMVHFHHDNDFPSDLVTAYHHVNKTNEEVEQIDELSKKTLASYIPKAAQSARFSGMTALDMQNRSDRARNKGMKDSYHRLSMKYKNKAWDREDNIAKAAQKLAKEDVEQIDELSKKTLGSYAKSAAAQTLGLSAALGAMKTVDGAVDAQRKLRNRYQGTQKAITKLAKEETEQIDELSKKTLQSYQSKIGPDLDRAMDAMPHGTGDDKEDRKLNNRMVGDERAQKRLMKMNKEETETTQADYLSPTLAFLDSLGEGKIDDLKDRMRMKQATMSAFDKDYKPAEKQHSNITVHKGTSYGAQDNGDEDEKDEKPEAKEKRGRGRPAGSKSGARV